MECSFLKNKYFPVFNFFQLLFKDASQKRERKDIPEGDQKKLDTRKQFRPQVILQLTQEMVTRGTGIMDIRLEKQIISSKKITPAKVTAVMGTLLVVEVTATGTLPVVEVTAMGGMAQATLMVGRQVGQVCSERCRFYLRVLFSYFHFLKLWLFNRRAWRTRISWSCRRARQV